jgi:hypothetical protein
MKGKQMSGSATKIEITVLPGLLASEYVKQIEDLILEHKPKLSEDTTAWRWVGAAVDGKVPRALAEECARTAVNSYRYQCSQEASKKG